MQIVVPDDLGEITHRGECPVVAADSTAFAFKLGLPSPFHEIAFQRARDVISQANGVFALTAVLNGKGTFPVDLNEFERVFKAERKATREDLERSPGIPNDDRSTTISAALAIANEAGIRVAATSGFGTIADGIESDDLAALAEFPGVVVCAGPKPFGNIPATMQFLRSKGVKLVGYQTEVIPTFFAQFGMYADLEISDISELQTLVGRHEHVVLMVPPENPIPLEVLRPMIAEAERVAAEESDPSKRTTIRLNTLRSLYAAHTGDPDAMPNLNVDLIVRNAEIAVQVAREIDFPRSVLEQRFAGR